MFVYLLLLIISLACSAVGTVAEAVVYHVATNGNDTTGNGSLSLPWLTIPKGIRALSRGDTLLIHGGTYNLTATYGNGSADTWGCKPLCPTSWETATKIMNAPGEAAVIKGFGFNIDSKQPGVQANGGIVSYLIWEGEETSKFIHESALATCPETCTNDSTGMRIAHNVDHIRIKKLRIRRFGSHGITGGGDPSLGLKPKFIQILQNDVWRNGNGNQPAPHDTNHEHGIYPNGGADWLIDGNFFFENFAFGVHLNPGSAPDTWAERFIIVNNLIMGKWNPLSTSASGIVITKGTGHVIANNVIVGKGTASGAKLGGCISVQNTTNIPIYNNTCFDVPYGIQTINTAGTTVRNNIFDDIADPFQINTSVGTVGSHNICQINDTHISGGCPANLLTSTPGFVTPGSDFHLTAGSIAVDTGTTLSTVITDKDGNARPQPAGGFYDVGAYERTSVNPPPAVPGGLEVH